MLEEFRDRGYYIGINPAWKIQERHRRIIEKADLGIMLTESDAPYNYRKLELKPSMVVETIDYISSVKGIKREDVIRVLLDNYHRLFHGI